MGRLSAAKKAWAKHLSPACAILFATFGCASLSAFAQTTAILHTHKKGEPKKAHAPVPTRPTQAPSPVEDKSATPEGSDALRKAAQNPIANLISVPFQNNTNFDVGPYHRPQNVLNFQPVVPIHITDDWNLITRWITPIVYQPKLSPNDGVEFGLGNLAPAFFLSPVHSGEIIWGVGTQTWLPTATDKNLGINKWGAGPAAVALTIQGPWVIGILANNVWAGTANRRVNMLTVQPFVNYNLPQGWYLTSSPVITSNWVAKGDDRWTVPIGGGFGRLFKVDKLPINTQIQAFYNVARPTNGPSWTLRFQIQFLFPG
jgi:hypothetical protein